MPKSQNSIGRTLQTHLQPDGNKIHWHYIRLGLQEMPGTLVNAKLCEESSKTISTHCQHTTITIPERPDPVQCKETIRNTRIKSTFVRRQGQTIHPTGMQKIPIPRQSSGQHPPLPNQRHCCAIIQADRGHNATDPPTPRLSCQTGRSHTLLPWERYGISSPQQCQLFKQVQGTQPSWWTLLSL